MNSKKKSNWVKTIGLGFLYGIISYLLFVGGSVVIDAINKERKKISTIILNPSEEYSDKKTIFAKEGVGYWGLPKNCDIKKIIVDYKLK